VDGEGRGGFVGEQGEDLQVLGVPGSRLPHPISTWTDEQR
jgi:hypothetical protein